MHLVNLTVSHSFPVSILQATLGAARNRILSTALLILATFALSGCATKVDLKYDGHPSGAAVQVREVALKSYLSAQLAHNAYAENEFKLPTHVTELEPIVETPQTGFAVRTYWVRPSDQKPYVVIAFRGTQFSSWADWRYGNLTNEQYRQGLNHVRRIKDKVPAETEIIVTGHSLGGAIATSVSFNEENIAVYGFDASLRVRRGLARNQREYVSHHAEILAALRKLVINPYGRYTVINCGVGGGFISRHDMRKLAICLTRIAAWDDKTAEWSRKENGMGPKESVLRAPRPAAHSPEQWRKPGQ